MNSEAGSQAPKLLVIQNQTPQSEESLAILLRKLGYDVLAAADGETGLFMASADPPDGLICDMPIADLDSVELCRRLRADRRVSRVPLLLIGSFEQSSDTVQACLRAGADDYLRIPYDPFHLLTRIIRLIERRHAEAAFSNRGKYLRLMDEHATDNVTILDSDGNVLYESAAVTRFTGYQPEEFIGKNKFGRVDPDDLIRLRHAIQSGVRQDGAGSPIHYRHRHKDGSWRFLESVLKPYIDESGKVKFIVNTRDVTALKLAEEKLLENQAQLAEIQLLAHIGTFEWDLASGRWTVSDELHRILGLDQRATITHELISKYVAVQERMAILSIFRKAVADQQPFLYEQALNCADGKLRFLEVRGRVTVGPFGKTMRLIGICRDITESKSPGEALGTGKEQFLESQRMQAVGQLAEGVANDFSNLVAVISDYIDLVLNGLTQNDPLRKHIEEIRNTTIRASLIAHQLLAMSQRQVAPRTVDINTTIKDLAGMLSGLIGENIEFETFLDGDFGNLKIDPGQIEQLILNLVINARDAMPEGGKLTVETRNVTLDEKDVPSHPGFTPGDYVMISVSNTGSDTKSGPNASISLSTVHNIVKQSGGFILTQGEVDTGTDFTVYLPRVRNESEDVLN